MADCPVQGSAIYSGLPTRYDFTDHEYSCYSKLNYGEASSMGSKLDNAGCPAGGNGIDCSRQFLYNMRLIMPTGGLIETLITQDSLSRRLPKQNHMSALLYYKEREWFSITCWSAREGVKSVVSPFFCLSHFR
jgi:hypothetical protein